MAYSEITNVQISLETSVVSRAGFGTALFISDHVWFTERTRTYTDLESAAADLPTDSDAYKAIVSALSNTPDPEQIKIGRREVDTITFTPEAATAAGQVYELTVVGTDDVAIAATFTTTTGSETAADITAAFATALTGIVGVTVTDNTGTLSLAKSGTAAYAVTKVTRFTYATVTTETAADVMSAITAIDNDFYFVACNDHTQAFILAMAADIEAREKIYFTSVGDSASLGAYSATATDTLSQLRQNAYMRTSAWFHQDADSVFPEVSYITIASPANPGKKVWAPNRAAFGAAENPTSGLLLSVTEKTNLTDKYANFVEVIGGINATSGQSGKVSGNEWVDVIRNRDFLGARVTEAYQSLLINKPVIPYTDAGINTIRNTLTQTLDRYVETDTEPHILEQGLPYEIKFKRRLDVDPVDVTNRVFNGEFVAYLSGAIQIVKIVGSLQYRTTA